MKIKKYAMIGSFLILIAVIGIFVVKKNTSSEEKSNYSFLAVVTEVSGSMMNIKPVEGTSESISYELFRISSESITDDSQPQVGDTYKIVYDGDIRESYPAQIPGIISVTLESKKK